jgi:hypothetical protein
MHAVLLALLLSVPIQAPTLYVSPAGDDNTAIVGDPNLPWRTIAGAVAALAGKDKAAHGSILLQRGGTWDEPFPFLAGLSADQPFRIGSYGDGPRPMLIATNVRRVGVPWEHTSVESIDFYGRAHDPSLADFVPPARATLWGGNFDEGMRVNATVRDCRFRFVGVAMQQRPPHAGNVIEFDRCVFLDAWNSGGGHVSGLYTTGLGVWVHDSVFDHGGWSESVEGAWANMFNHNLYLSAGLGVQVERNVILRSSSIGIKIRNDEPGGGRGEHLVIRDNFVAEGEVGFSVGGNTELPARFIRPLVAHNVLFALGRTLDGPALGIHAYDWVGGEVVGNLMINPPDGWQGGTTFFINCGGAEDTTRVAGNQCVGVRGSRGAFRAYGGPSQRLVVEDNLFDTDGIGAGFTAPPEHLVWRRNRFSVPVEPPRGKVILQWQTKPVDAAVLSEAEVIPAARDPALVLPCPWPEFVARVRAQGETGWDESLMAPALNDRARAVYGMGRVNP